jgi:hypothetical protein
MHTGLCPRRKADVRLGPSKPLLETRRLEQPKRVLAPFLLHQDALLLEKLENFAADAFQESLDVFLAGRGQRDETDRAPLPLEHPVRHHDVEVRSQLERRTKPLHEGDGPGLAMYSELSGPAALERKQRPQAESQPGGEELLVSGEGQRRFQGKLNVHCRYGAAGKTLSTK